MSDRHDSDDDRFEEPPTTFIGILEKSLEGFEGVLDEIREGVEDADEDYPLDPDDPLDRIRKKVEETTGIDLDPESGGVVINVEEELKTLRENAGISKDVEDQAKTHGDYPKFPQYPDSEDLPPYAEARGAPLLKAIGDGPRQRILATFIGKHYTEVSTGDVLTLTKLEQSELVDHLHELEDLGLLEANRMAGGSTKWSLNTDHPIARKLAQLDHACIQEWLGDG